MNSILTGGISFESLKTGEDVIIDDQQLIAEEFDEFFVSVGETLSNKILGAPFDEEMEFRSPHSMFFYTSNSAGSE